MLKHRIIPCLDVRDGRVVKGVRFQSLRDAGCPVEQARAYEAQGADELVVLDVSATPEARGTAAHTVEAVRAELSIPLCVGGGVRTADNAATLLDAGADKVGVNSAAVTNPGLITEIAERFGAQCTVVAIDAARPADDTAGPWQVVTRSGTQREPLDAVAWAIECERRGAGEILLTSWDRDGTGEGYDTDLLRAISSVVSIPVIASGGVSTLDHLVDGVRAGASAVLAASIFHDGIFTIHQAKAAMAGAGLEVRR
jgi:imidazoleglycerol phosphate synthase cyclase subunit